MRDETFIRKFKEIYPNTYISLEEEFEKHTRKEAAYKRVINREHK